MGDSLHKRQEALATIVGEMHKGTPSPKSGKAIKVWLNQVYTTIIAVARKISENVLQEDPKLLMWYDQAVTRIGG